MSYEQFETRLGFIIYGDNKWRIRIRKTETGIPEVTYDAHGQTVKEAKRTIENIVNGRFSPLRLNVIHGYNHGTAIKSMLSEETFCGRLTERNTPKNNPGITKMVISAVS